MKAVTRFALLAGILASGTSAEAYKARRQVSSSASPYPLPSTSSIKFPYVPRGSGAALTVTAAEAVCSGATLNVLEASLDWWYPQTYTYVASTLVVEYDSNSSPTGWTLEPAATPFDITSAVATPVCTTITSSNVLQPICTSTPTPLAASTTLVEQIAYATLSATSGSGSAPNVAITPAPAAITIPNSGGSFSAGTPFVFFSRYEIATSSAVTVNGSVSCAVATSTYGMKNPFSFQYTGGDVNGTLQVNAGVTGDVNPAFLGVVNVTNVIAGSWVAAPTVAVVVSRIIEVSQSALDVPSPTLPSAATTGPTYTAEPIYVTTASSLSLPTGTMSPISSTSSASSPARTGTVSSASVVTIAGQGFTVTSAAVGSSSSGTVYVIGGQTLTPGGTVVLTSSGSSPAETVSLNSAGNSVYVGSGNSTVTSSLTNGTGLAGPSIVPYTGLSVRPSAPNSLLGAVLGALGLGLVLFL